ncbi:MAG: hypothetical protein M3Q46_04730, partial [Verrucomicrobiota bacterium]|nr:hypothetical protein [Verrucomicrobiota bacterium]
GSLVKLFGSGPVTIPNSVTVPAGQTSVTFTVSTQPVSVSFDVTITAYIGSVGLSSPLTLVP